MSTNSPLFLAVMAGAAIVCAVSCYLNLRSNKRIKKVIDMHPHEKLFMFRRGEFMDQIEKCTEPLALDKIIFKCDEFISEEAQMIDEILYSQTIIDLEHALHKKQKSLAKK